MKFWVDGGPPRNLRLVDMRDVSAVMTRPLRTKGGMAIAEGSRVLLSGGRILVTISSPPCPCGHHFQCRMTGSEAAGYVKLSRPSGEGPAAASRDDGPGEV